MLPNSQESATVATRKPLLRPDPIPSRAAILERMVRRFGEASGLMRDILEPCAEETERILLEVLRKQLGIWAEGVAITAKRYANSTQFKFSGYSCPACLHEYVNHHDQFCAGCGRPIEWKY